MKKLSLAIMVLIMACWLVACENENQGYKSKIEDINSDISIMMSGIATYELKSMTIYETENGRVYIYTIYEFVRNSDGISYTMAALSIYDIDMNDSHLYREIDIEVWSDEFQDYYTFKRMNEPVIEYDTFDISKMLNE